MAQSAWITYLNATPGTEAESAWEEEMAVAISQFSYLDILSFRKWKAKCELYQVAFHSRWTNVDKDMCNFLNTEFRTYQFSKNEQVYFLIKQFQ